MRRRTVLGMLVLGIPLTRLARARADCAMPETFASLRLEGARPIARDGALLATVETDYGQQGMPLVRHTEGGRMLDADLSFSAGGRTIACNVTYDHLGFFRLKPAETLPEGDVSLVGFHRRGATSAPRRLVAEGMAPPALAALEATSGTYRTRTLPQIRWGTPVQQSVRIALERPIPEGAALVYFEHDGWSTRFPFEVGSRALVLETTVGGSHCGDDGPSMGAAAAPLTGIVVMVDRYGRVTRGARPVTLR